MFSRRLTFVSCPLRHSLLPCPTMICLKKRFSAENNIVTAKETVYAIIRRFYNSENLVNEVSFSERKTKQRTIPFNPTCSVLRTFVKDIMPRPASTLWAILIYSDYVSFWFHWSFSWLGASRKHASRPSGWYLHQVAAVQKAHRFRTLVQAATRGVRSVGSQSLVAAGD